jgi:hypothetical protein
MKIYLFKLTYGHYTGESDAFESPRRPGDYLIPLFATDIKPPECELREIQIIDGNSWKVIEDKRGIYYCTQTQHVMENDNPLESPENSTKEQPPEVPEGHFLTWNDGWVLEQIIPPTPQEKLESLGLTVEDLKVLLGI